MPFLSGNPPQAATGEPLHWLLPANPSSAQYRFRVMRANRAAHQARIEAPTKLLRQIIGGALKEAITRNLKGEKPKEPPQGADGFPPDMPEDIKAMLTSMGLDREHFQETMEKAHGATDDPVTQNPFQSRPLGEDGFPLDIDPAIRDRLFQMGYKPGSKDQTFIIEGDGEDQVNEIMDLLKRAGAVFKAKVVKVGKDIEDVDVDNMPADLPEAFRKVLLEAAASRKGHVEPADGPGMANRTFSALMPAPVVEPGQPEPEPIVATVRLTEADAAELHALMNETGAPPGAHLGQGFLNLRGKDEVDCQCQACTLMRRSRPLFERGEVLRTQPVEEREEGFFLKDAPVNH